ncbi:flagellar hook-associated protein FlgK [Alishewanella agri BL06]|jgi:flagellar hook-associated protein 1 FlgK|uniref:Flagellar hook-associated protein 1 n=1 Tax=Alishewanella agri BL06 TaxID=1195246 RepID=I8UAI7_9ALTE|nr:flagellar hook-associated protein FlgK [Alishewanella agri]EIW90251.1 flagellar hook-associated protein FlgK [Alishewanella agri BL06]
MADSLLSIGKTAVLANSRLLNTTGNNIANINTPGYVRQRTTFVAEQFGLGVGQGTTERLVNEFTQKQLRRDTTNAAYSSQYLAEANRLDALFSNAANSIATGMNNLFQQIQTANNDPTQLSNRQLVIGTSQSLLDQFKSMSTLIADQEQFLNQQLDANVSEVNDLISQIATYNNDIVSYGSSSSRPVPLDLLDRRDSAILKLAEYVDIQTVNSNSGEKLVFMASGQALVVERGEFNLFSLRGEPDPNDRVIQLTLQSNNDVRIELDAKGVGGKIGALTDYRLQVVNPVQRQLGQLALTLADSMNTQNKLGLTLNGTIGQDLFRLPAAQGLSFSTNSANARVSVSIEPGESGKLPPNDFLLEVIDANNIRLTPLDDMGNPITANAKNINSPTGIPGVFNSADVADGDLYGLQLQVDAAVAGDRFVLKPLNAAARSMQMATNRAEDVALAGPLRGDFTAANLGNGRIEGVKIFSTDPGSSAFTSSSLVDGPYTVTFQGQDSADNDRFVFSITDINGVTLGEARFSSNNFNNVLENSVGSPSLKDTLGFDFSITGVPRAGDTFTIAFNENGFNDNRNGLELSALQNASLVRRNPEPFGAAVNQYSLNQSYATMVGNIGERTRQARTADEANAAILEQTTLWYESLSGVNLDEEAADLVRFQQSYAAAAKILATSQTVFDTLLQAVR